MLGFITKHPVKSILAVAIGATVAVGSPFVLPIIFAGAISTAVVATVTVAMSLAVTGLVYGIGRLFGFLFSRGDHDNRQFVRGTGRRNQYLVISEDEDEDETTIHQPVAPGNSDSYRATIRDFAQSPTSANQLGDWNEGEQRMPLANTPGEQWVPRRSWGEQLPQSRPAYASAEHEDWKFTTAFGAEHTLSPAAPARPYGAHNRGRFNFGQDDHQVVPSAAASDDAGNRDHFTMQ